MTERDRPLAYVISPRQDGGSPTGDRSERHDAGGMSLRPLPQLVLAALAGRSGWDARVVDEGAEPIPADLPDLALISAYTATAPSAYNLADWFRARGVPVVLGGVHPSLVPGEALLHADAVVTGEAEAILGEVLDDAAAGRLQRLYHGGWVGMEAVPGIDEYRAAYTSGPWKRIPIHSIQTARGCRFNCSFCSVIRMNGRGMRHMEPERVAAELQSLRRISPRLPGGTPIYLLDDDLMSDRDYTAEMFEGLIRAGIRSPLIIQASSGFGRDAEMLDLAGRAGVVSVFIGFESVSRESLLEANKKNRPHLYREIVAGCHRHGIGVSAGIIFGFDHDRPGVFDETVDVMEEIGVDSVRFTILTPMPGTETFATYFADGRIVDLDWSRYDGMAAVIEPVHMSRHELQVGLVHAYRRWYGTGARARRFARQARHVSWRVAGAFALGGRRFATHLEEVMSRPSHGFVPREEDLRAVVEVSRAPASEAITTATALVGRPPAVPVALGVRPERGPAGRS